MKKFYLFIFILITCLSTKAQTPQLAWQKTFSSKSAATDSTSLIKINTVENTVYIAGTSDAWGKGNDIVLIKRNITTGDTIWTRHYNGPANGDDQVADFVINQTTGDVYVTGKSMGNGTAYDVVTLKYLANGDLSWAKRWDNATDHADDIPKAIGLDNSGNVIIIGTTFQGGDNDILHIAYNSSGVVLLGNYSSDNLSGYAASYNIYGSMDNVGGARINNSGQVYVAGDFLIGSSTNGYSEVYSCGFKMSDIGWSDLYSTSCVGFWGMYDETNYSGFPKGVTISTPDDFNIYNAMDMDNSNNVYLAFLNDTIVKSGQGYTARIAKVNSTGCQVWEKKYGKSSNARDLGIKSVKVDLSGNVYIAGFEKNTSGNFDWVVIKYNSSGAFQWKATKKGTANGNDIPFDIAFDSYQNPYVAGLTKNTGTNKDITVVKYSKSNGAELFTINYDSNNKDECAYNIVVDGDQNIFVNGISNSGNQTSKMLTLKYCNPPAAAGTITGVTNICQGQNSVTYSVSEIDNATCYVWTLPPGVTGTSTTNSISVSFGANATSGGITVKGRNSCSDGASSSLTINVNPKPTTPIVSINGNALHSNASAGNQWYNKTGAITGATTQDYTPKSSGDYYVIVNSNNCNSDVSNTIHFIPTGITPAELTNALKVYPNPVTNELTIELNDNITPVKFGIVNSSGQSVYNGVISNKVTIQTSNFAPGVYLIRLESGRSFEFKKIIKK